MPEPDYVWLPRTDILTFEEIDTLVDIFGKLGVDKVRLTGGEPLLRTDLPDLIALLAQKRSLCDLALTTNGILLADQVTALRAAGLPRLTVSLDTLQADRFKALTRIDSLDAVLRGLEMAVTSGFNSVKVDTVVIRGVNDDELIPILEHGRELGVEVRFIEYMDVGNTNQWRMDEVMPVGEILELIDSYYPLRELESNYRGEVARRWEYCDGKGEIGMISSVSHPFCGDCTRARLSPEGKLYTCLFSSQGYRIVAFLDFYRTRSYFD